MQKGDVVANHAGERFLVAGTGHGLGTGPYVDAMSVETGQRTKVAGGQLKPLTSPTESRVGPMTRFLTAWAYANQVGAQGLALTCSTMFEPFQYRPLIKYQGEANGRILVCDETGLGKTIETGYILVEEYAAGRAKKIILMVKKRSIPKWREEMRSFFGLKFEEVTSAKRLLTKLNREGSYLIITSHDIGRQHHKQWWTEVESGPDIMVVDEIHNCIGSNQTFRRPMIQHLAHLSHGFVGLTATPVRTSTDDLSNTLQIVVPDSLKGIDFHHECDVLRAINTLCHQLLNEDDPNLNPTLEMLNDVLDDERKITLASMSITSAGNAKERILWAEELRQFCPFARHITRARGKDPEINRYTPRIVHDTHWIEFEGRELEVFDAIDAVLFEHFRHIHRVMLASCRPAAYDLMAKGAEGILGYNGTPEQGIQVTPDGQAECKTVGQRLVRLGNKHDKKFETLWEVLEEAIEDDDINDIVIFTHFWPTHQHLERKLKAKIDTEKVHLLAPGKHAAEDELIGLNEKMESDARTSILLATDKINEAVNLHAANCVINYDLPYNPQDLQQRIGRVDRIVQKADQIHVHNLAVRNSVDETIVDRLIERTNVFRGIIGGMEDVIAEAPDLATQEEMSELVGQAKQRLEKELLAEDDIMLQLVDRVFDNDILEQRRTSNLAQTNQHLLWKKAFETVGGIDCLWNPETSTFEVGISPELCDFLVRVVLNADLANDRRLARAFDACDDTGTLSICLAGEHAMVSPLHPLNKWVIFTCMQLENLAAKPVSEQLSGLAEPPRTISVVTISGTAVTRRVLLEETKEISANEWIEHLEKGAVSTGFSDVDETDTNISGAEVVQQLVELERTEHERIRNAQLRRLYAWKNQLEGQRGEEGVEERLGRMDNKISHLESQEAPPEPTATVVFRQRFEENY